jgi:hypothetical protein
MPSRGDRRPRSAAVAAALGLLLAAARLPAGEPDAGQAIDPGPSSPQAAGGPPETAEATRIAAASGVRLRRAPDPAAPIVATLPVGERLTELQAPNAPSPVGDPGGQWLRVRAGVQTGVQAGAQAETQTGTRTGAAPAQAQVEGWVFAPLTLAIDPAEPNGAYRTLLQRRAAETAARPWADDFELLMLIARLLAPGQGQGAADGLPGAALDRIEEGLKSACRYDPQDPRPLDLSAFRTRLAPLLGQWQGQVADPAQPPPELASLGRIGALANDCAALHLRTLIEREALGGLAVGIAGRQVGADSKCRFRRHPPETSEVGDTFARWSSPACGIELTLVLDDDGDQAAGEVTGIRLGPGFAGRTRAGIGIGSREAELLAAYGPYLDPGARSFAVASGDWVCEQGASVVIDTEAGRVSAIELGWGHCD